MEILKIKRVSSCDGKNHYWAFSYRGENVRLENDYFCGNLTSSIKKGKGLTFYAIHNDMKGEIRYFSDLRTWALAIVRGLRYEYWNNREKIYIRKLFIPQEELEKLLVKPEEAVEVEGIKA